MSKRNIKQFYGTTAIKKFYHEGRMFIFISDAMMESPAYIALTPSAQLILIDLIRHIRDEFRDVIQIRADKTPFTYTYAMCRVRVSENTFLAAMKQFVEKGWLNIIPEDQVMAVASAVRYRLSERWRRYTFSDEERQKFYHWSSQKQKRLLKNYTNKSKIHCQKTVPAPTNLGLDAPHN